MAAFIESEIEVFSLEELQGIGFDYLPGPSCRFSNINMEK